MDAILKRRILGALVLLALAVLIVPAFFSGPNSADKKVSSSKKIPHFPAAPDAQDLYQIKDGQFVAPKTLPAENTAQSIDTTNTEAPLLKSVTSAQPGPVQAAANVEPQISSAPLSVSPTTPTKAVTKTSVKAKSAEQWVLQIASFAKEKNAKALQGRLEAQGFAAYTQSAMTSIGKRYRVYVGPKATRKEAVDLLAPLEKHFGIKAVVLQSTT